MVRQDPENHIISRDITFVILLFGDNDKNDDEFNFTTTCTVTLARK